MEGMHISMSTHTFFFLYCTFLLCDILLLESVIACELCFHMRRIFRRGKDAQNGMQHDLPMKGPKTNFLKFFFATT